MIFLDAENRIVGRIASFAAKRALKGDEQIVILNAEKAVITGSKENALKRMQTRLSLRAKGNPENGPHFSRMPDRVLRHAVRGMLPWKGRRGREAFRKVRVFIGIPNEFKGKPFTAIDEKSQRGAKRFVQLGVVCKLLGAEW